MIRWALLAILLAGAGAVEQGSGGTHCFRDIPYYFMPQSEACRQAIAGGEVPLWNPFANCGQPLLATWQCAVASPLSVPFMVLPWEHAIRVFWIFAMLAAAAGAFALALRAGISPAGACLAAVLYGGGGPMRTMAEWPPIVAGMALLPAFLAAATDLVRGGRGAVALTGILGALQLLVGQPRQAMFAVFALALWVAALRPRRVEWRALAGRLAAAGALALAVSAVQLLPVLSLFPASERGTSGITASSVAESFLRIRDLPTAFAGLLWGDEHRSFGGGRLLVPRLYVGFAGLWLAFTALARSRGPAVSFGLSALLGGLVLALGERFYGALSGLFAEFTILRYMGHFTLVSFLGVCILAGAGADSLPGRRPFRPWAPLSAAALALVFLSPLGPPILAAMGWPADPAYVAGSLARLRGGLLVGAGSLAAVWAAFRYRSRWARYAVPAILAFDLAFTFHGYHLRAGTGFFGRPAYLSGFTLTGGRLFSPTDAEPLFADEARISLLDRYRARWLVLSPNIPQVFGIRNAHGYEPFRPRAIRDIFGGWEGRQETPDAALRATGVRWAVGARQHARPGWKEARHLAADWSLWEVPGAAPLASVVPRDASPASWRGLEGVPVRGTARMEEEGWNGMRVDSDSSGGGKLLLRVLYDPGWRAEVDGKRAPVARFAGTFMSVPVPPGKASIRLRYAPFPFALGLFISIIAVSALAVGGIAVLVPGRRRTP